MIYLIYMHKKDLTLNNLQWLKSSTCAASIPFKPSVVKIGVKITTHLSVNVNAYAPHTKSISLTRKNMAALSEPFIANGHASSLWQSRKTTESEDAHGNEGRQKRTKTMNVVTRGLLLLRWTRIG